MLRSVHANCLWVQASCETHPPRASDLAGLHGLQKTKKERGEQLLPCLGDYSMGWRDGNV